MSGGTAAAAARPGVDLGPDFAQLPVEKQGAIVLGSIFLIWLVLNYFVQIAFILGAMFMLKPDEYTFRPFLDHTIRESRTTSALGRLVARAATHATTPVFADLVFVRLARVDLTNPPIIFLGIFNRWFLIRKPAPDAPPASPRNGGWW